MFSKKIPVNSKMKYNKTDTMKLFEQFQLQQSQAIDKKVNKNNAQVWLFLFIIFIMVAMASGFVYALQQPKKIADNLNNEQIKELKEKSNTIMYQVNLAKRKAKHERELRQAQNEELQAYTNAQSNIEVGDQDVQDEVLEKVAFTPEQNKKDNREFSFSIADESGIIKDARGASIPASPFITQNKQRNIKVIKHNDSIKGIIALNGGIQ
jgi:uncharacterized protein HemX